MGLRAGDYPEFGLDNEGYVPRRRVNCNWVSLSARASFGLPNLLKVPGDLDLSGIHYSHCPGTRRDLL